MLSKKIGSGSEWVIPGNVILRERPPEKIARFHKLVAKWGPKIISLPKEAELLTLPKSR